MGPFSGEMTYSTYWKDIFIVNIGTMECIKSYKHKTFRIVPSLVGAHSQSHFPSSRERLVLVVLEEGNWLTYVASNHCLGYALSGRTGSWSVTEMGPSSTGFITKYLRNKRIDSTQTFPENRSRKCFPTRYMRSLLLWCKIRQRNYKTKKTRD